MGGVPGGFHVKVKVGNKIVRNVEMSLLINAYQFIDVNIQK